MNKSSNARYPQPKKLSKRNKSTKKKTKNQNFYFLSRFIPKNRKGVFKLVLALVIFIAIVGAIPFPHTFAKSTTVDFTTENQKTADLELGDSKVLQEGRDGTKVVNIESFQSIWGRLLGLEPIQQKEVSEKIVEKPVNKIVAKGSKKYQYMLCSNGSYRYYNDEQFKAPNVGFTSKSEDGCKKNNQGVKLKLADTPNGSATNQAPPSMANNAPAPKDCDSTYIYFMNNFYLSGTKRALDFLTQQNERVFSYNLPKDEEDKEINKNIKYYNDSVANYYNGLRQSLNDNGCAHKAIGFEPAAVPFR